MLLPCCYRVLEQQQRLRLEARLPSTCAANRRAAEGERRRFRVTRRSWTDSAHLMEARASPLLGAGVK